MALGDSTLGLNIGLPSFSPTSSYSGFDLYRYLVRAVCDGVHPFDHRLLQPDRYIFCLLCITLDDHFVVAHENRYSPYAPMAERDINPNMLTDGMPKVLEGYPGGFWHCLILRDLE